MNIRKGDLLPLAEGVGEVLSVVANSEGGVDIVVRVAPAPEALSLTVMREDDDERAASLVPEVEAE